MSELSKLNYVVGKKKKSRVKALGGCPAKKAVCLKTGLTMSPRKPNSAKRQVVRVKLSNGRYLIIFVPGESYNNLKVHSTVPVCGRGCRDLPGINYHAVRGWGDLSGIPVRRTSRSRYGTKRSKN